jgi:hypothetical protein
VEGPIDLDYGRIGQFTHRDRLIEVFTELACRDHVVEMHHGQNPQIRIIDDTCAAGRWGLYYYLIDTRQNTVTQLAGFYDDEYRRADGEWRILKSVYEVTSTQIFDLSEGVARLVFAGRTAPRALDDPARQAP